MSMRPVTTTARQFGAFLIVGGWSTLISLLIRYLLNLIAIFEVAVVAAQIGGMICAFVLNKLYVFPESRHATALELWRFALVNVVSLIIATFVSSYLYRYAFPAIGLDAPLLAHVGGLAACTVPSFVGHKFFSFKSRQ